MFDKNILNRYVCTLFFGDGNKINCIIDTACSTSLIPLIFAKQHGEKLEHTADVTVAGNTYKAILYRFSDLKFGNFIISKMVAFASDYKGNIADSALLGLNVLNNFVITLKRRGKELQFDYVPWVIVKDKPHPCTMFFKGKGSNPVYPNDFIVEFEVDDSIS